MNFPGCVVIEHSNSWLIVLGDQVERLAGDINPAEIGVCASLMTKLAGQKNPSCILAPDSNSCYFAAIEPDEDIDVRDRAALTYELEDDLPIDAEAMVADFVPYSRDGKRSVSAVAIEAKRWREIAESIESAGMPVRSIVPRALLAAAAMRELDDSASPELLIIGDDNCDSLILRNGVVESWRHVGIDLESLRRHQMLSTNSADVTIVAGADAEQTDHCRALYPDAIFLDQASEELAIQGACKRLNDRTIGWFELRRGALGPSDPLRALQNQIRIAGCAIAACLLAFAVGGWWRAHRIDQAVAQIRTQQQELFRQAFPDSRVPGALLRRVRSEHTKTLGSRGATQVEIPQSAPEVLRELIAAMPRDVRFRLTNVSVLNGRVNMDLQVRNPVDAGALADSLSAAGFEVKPPGTTQKDSRTYQSQLEAKWIGRDAKPADNEVSLTFSVRKESRG